MRRADRFFCLPCIVSLIGLLLAGCFSTNTPTTNQVDHQATTTPDTTSTDRITDSASLRLPTPSPEVDIPALEAGAAAPTAAPTPVHTSFTPDEPVRLVIEAINLDDSLIAVGLDENMVPIVPEHQPGWYNRSATPGSGENVVLWGHVLRFRDAPEIPAPFARLHEITPDASITVHTADGLEHTYIVSELIWATPDQVDYILPQGEERLTLVSCIGDTVIDGQGARMSHRLITIAQPET